MVGQSLILLLVGLLTSYTTARSLQRSPMASQHLIHAHPNGSDLDAYDHFVKSCLYDEENLNATNHKNNVHRKTVGGSAPNYNAFAFDINACLFNGWTTTTPPVLSGPVQCSGGGLAQLCYGLSPPTAQFAVCYDTNRRIPVFTGHVLKFHASSSATFPPVSGPWRENKAGGVFSPTSQALSKDYDPSDQIRVHGASGWSQPKEYFCSRGHLTPKGDFQTKAERQLTFVVTNAAPQWQKFNNKNWAAIENAVRDYTKAKRKDLYIFTGTGGDIPLPSGGTFKLKNRVTAPRWYWKAVCDPSIRESIVFIAENNLNNMSTAKKLGCNGISQTSQNGLILCFDLDSARTTYTGLQLPPFERTSCKTNTQGTFLNSFIATQLTK